MTRSLKVALLGCGVVGSAVARGIISHPIDLGSRAGAPLELQAIVVKDPAEISDPEIPRELLTTDGAAAIEGADLVIELFGGIEPARTLILAALRSGASVVTANKALLAAHGPELFEAAAAAGVDLYFEAAVAGAIPIVRPLRESLAGDHIRRVIGIVNGTTNYVLDKMATDGLALAETVKQAQALGYAEADPTADVEGFDAAAKAQILASAAFHTRVALGDVAREGIMAVTADDVHWAEQTGHVIKLLATAELIGDPDAPPVPGEPPAGISVRVSPTLVPLAHPLASVRGVFNAVFIEADGAGELMFYGRGAGGTPTASAVLGDLVVAASNRLADRQGARESNYNDWQVLPASSAVMAKQLRLQVADEPGVLASLAGVLAERGVSIASLRQPPTTDEKVTQLIITTHPAPEAALSATVAALDSLASVQQVISVLPVLDA